MARTPAEWLRWYVRAEDRLGAPGLNPVVQHGRYYFKTCRATRKNGKPCGSKLRHLTKEGVYVCGRCGEVWPYEDRVQLKGAFQTSRRTDTSERMLSKHVDVGTIVSRLARSRRWRWQFRSFAALALGLRWREAVEQLRRFPLGWTRSRLYEYAREGGAEFRRLLLAAGYKVSSED